MPKTPFKNYQLPGYKGKKDLLLQPTFNPIDKTEIVLKEDILGITANLIFGGIFILFIFIFIFNYLRNESLDTFGKFVPMLFAICVVMIFLSQFVENYKKLNSEEHIKKVIFNRKGIINGKNQYDWDKIKDIALLFLYNDVKSKFVLIQYSETIIPIEITSLSEIKEFNQFNDFLPSFSSEQDKYDDLRNLIGKYLTTSVK